MFEEEKDDRDAYLNRFERMCTSCGIRREDWTMQLARLLKGSALEVYQRLPDEDLDNYDELKRTLLKRFQLTESGFRQRFKQSRILPHESPNQFVARLEKYLYKWRDMAGLEDSYEGLKTLILRDQYLVTCPKELRVYLKEKGRMKMSEMLECAENYMEAHAEDFRGKKDHDQSKHGDRFQGNRNSDVKSKP